MASASASDASVARAALSATSILTTYLLLPAVQPAGASKGSSGPGGKRLSLVQWGSYAKYFRQPALASLLRAPQRVAAQA